MICIEVSQDQLHCILDALEVHARRCRRLMGEVAQDQHIINLGLITLCSDTAVRAEQTARHLARYEQKEGPRGSKSMGASKTARA